MASSASEGKRFGSLLDDAGVGAIPDGSPSKPRWGRRVDEAIRHRARNLWNNPRRRNTALAVLIVLVLGGTVGAYIAFRPVPQPDFNTANIDVLFNYTLLTEEFNNLPIEERIELIAQLVERLKKIDGDQSLLMAVFAAKIQGEVRRQFERNASLLAVDLFDDYAEDFNVNAPPEDKDAFVEGKFIEFQKTLEKIGGFERDISDEERLIEARKQSKRDLEFAQSGRMPIENTVRMLSFVNQGVGREATGHQKIRINGFITQMVRTLREGEVPPEEEKPQRQREPEQDPAESPDDEPVDPQGDKSPMVEPKEIAPAGGGDEPEAETPAAPGQEQPVDDNGGEPTEPADESDDDGG